jgi:hypothetical protein
VSAGEAAWDECTCAGAKPSATFLSFYFKCVCAYERKPTTTPPYTYMGAWREREREIKEGQEGKLQEHSDDAHTRLKSTSLAYPGRGEWAQRGRAQAPTPARARVQAPALEQELPAAAAAAALSEAKDSEKAEGGECGAQLHEANLSPSYSTGCKRCSSSCKLSGMSVRARANALSNGKRVTCDIGGGGFWDATPLKGLGLTP